MKKTSLSTRVLIHEPAWFMTKGGKAVAIQYWDHNFQPCKGVNWRGMVVLFAEDRKIRDWVCVWYTIFGDGFFSDRTINLGDFDIIRKLEPHEIPADKPVAWMPEHDATVRRRLAVESIQA